VARPARNSYQNDLEHEADLSGLQDSSQVQFNPNFPVDIGQSGYGSIQTETGQLR